MRELIDFRSELRPIEKRTTVKSENETMNENDIKILVANAIQRASQKLSPLWDIRDYVAVNPFFGFRDQHFLDTAKFLKEISGKGILPQKEYFSKKYASGEITLHDLKAAILIFQKEKESSKLNLIDVDQLLKFVASQNIDETDNPKCISDLKDCKYKSDATEAITREISKWASAYFDEGQAVWRIPTANLRFFSWWKSLAIYENKLGRDNLDFTKLVGSLPEDPLNALNALTEKLLEKVALEPEELSRYFYSLIYTVMGWASFIQKIEFEATRSGDDTRKKKVGGLVDIVAIRMAYDIALLKEDLNCEDLKRDPSVNNVETELGYIWLIATEVAYRRKVEAVLKDRATRGSADDAPIVQAAFCIDVRSEILRRHLEKISPKIQTIGFAGFFGLPISLKGLGHQESDQNCPVLLNSNCEIREVAGEMSNRLERKKTNYVRNLYLRKAIQSSANSGFSFMETVGFSYIPKIISSSLGKKPNIDISSLGLSRQEKNLIHLDSQQLNAEQKLNLAFGALKNMGLTKNFAKYVFFFGHGSESANNPYSSALDCGACAGHNGKGNANLLATLLNEKAVRLDLGKKGIDIPDSTVFLSGWHNTTEDQLIVDDVDDLAQSQRDELKGLAELFEKASQNCRKERAEKLPGLENIQGEDLKQELSVRARDWSEIRPEWGLARNAAFIVGRRRLTRDLSLDGRSFLHDYDRASDHDLSVLELIMTAPMIVTNWINMQYYASTVDPQKFGAGNKVLNNVVGGIGCIQGNGSDLLGGLTEQSVWYKGQYFHEPMRLQVFIEADTVAIDKIIKKHQMVHELVSNGWLNIISIDPNTGEFNRYQSGSWIGTREEKWN